MTSLKLMADDLARSDWGQAFGLRNRPENANVLKIGLIWAEFALRVSHWIPLVGSVTGLLSLSLFAYRISGKNQADDEDIGELIRDIIAIAGGSMALAVLDLGATYFRAKEEIAPHKQYDYLS